ncbi:MAG: trypsin-like peptidase domain-containing protein [Elusimicrobia bacterium]|nr:trypsin-like peptidase domain-containing protein [Elusimicrobiota bacterium]
MKKLMAACAVLLAAARLAVPAAAQVSGQVIYGDDDRIDLWQAKDARLKSLADSTVALFEGGDVTLAGEKAVLATQNYGERMGLCKTEPFYEQPMGAFCSGSLVAPDVIMTAGHCVTSQDNCAGIKFVFGFAVKTKGASPTSVPAGDVYGCKELMGREQVGDGADWALVRLDRAVTGHKPLKLNKGGAIGEGTPIVVIGHPAGLPTKIAGGAKVRDASKPGFFVANLDTYGGNSGSAVFNAQTGLVEGILVRGEQDYVYNGSCRVSNKCPSDGCRGEDVTKIANVADKLPGLRHRSRAAELSPRVAAVVAALEAEAIP